MKAASIKDIKRELGNLSQDDLMELCLKMSKFRKENKELLTYLLFEAQDEAAYIENIKREMDELFTEVNLTRSYYAIKGVRKVQRLIKKYIRYSKNKETEVQLLIYFCEHLSRVNMLLGKNTVLRNIGIRQIEGIRKTIAYLHEDLQYDYKMELDEVAAKM